MPPGIGCLLHVGLDTGSRLRLLLRQWPATQGRIKFQMFPGSVLGGEKEMIEQALAIGRGNYGDSNVDLQIATMDEYDAQREVELSRALDAYRMAAKLNPNDAQVLFALALAYDGRGDTVGVVTVLQQLESLDSRVAALLRKTLTGKE